MHTNTENWTVLVEKIIPDMARIELSPIGKSKLLQSKLYSYWYVFFLIVTDPMELSTGLFQMAS